MKEYYSKVEQIEKIESKKNSSINQEDFYILATYSKDYNSEIRSLVAQLLGSIPCDDSEDILLPLLQDEDMMVRVEACDSLGFSKSPKVLQSLCKKAKHEQWMVRRYAVLSIGDIAKKQDKIEQIKIYYFLRDLLNKENNPSVRLSYYYALVLLGKTKYYNHFLNKINHRDYHVRCAVCNLIPDVIDKNLYKFTEKKLKERLAIENSRAVISSIERALSHLKK